MKRYTCACALLFALTLAAQLDAIAPKPTGQPAPPHAPTPLPSTAGSKPVPHPAPAPVVVPQAHPTPVPAPVAHAAPSPLPHPTPPVRPAPSLVTRPTARPTPAVVTRPPPTAHPGAVPQAHPAPRPAPVPVAQIAPPPPPHPTPPVRPAPSLVTRPTARPNPLSQVKPVPRPSPNLVSQPTLHPLPHSNPGDSARPVPGIVHRPGTPGGQHPAVVNRPTITGNSNRPTTDLTSTNIRRNSLSAYQSKQTNIVNRTGGGHGRGRPDGGWRDPYQRLHEGWHRGGWNFGRFQPAGWVATNSPFGWLPPLGGDLPYSNPYCVVPAAPLATPFLDYSNPIPVPAVAAIQLPVPVPAEIPLPVDNSGEPPPLPADSTAPAGGADDSEKQEAARQAFGQAREAFKKGDYALAQGLVEQALQNVPGDPTLHEFRALTLFAQNQYREAAATIYAVLAVGPGWNWDTLKDLYPDVQTYTVQLRALEDYRTKNPRSGEVHFLLGYHYLVLGSTPAAIKQFERVVALTPKDELSARLLMLLKQPQAADDRPGPQP